MPCKTYFAKTPEKLSITGSKDTLLNFHRQSSDSFAGILYGASGVPARAQERDVPNRCLFSLQNFSGNAALYAVPCRLHRDLLLQHRSESRSAQVFHRLRFGYPRFDHRSQLR